VGTFEEEARRLLRSAREVFFFLFVSSGGGDVGHGRVRWWIEAAMHNHAGLAFHA